jgi:predicted kinase
MFIVFSGLPGTGKSTLAARLAERLAAVYLRIDSIEQAIRASGVLADGADIGPAGYEVAYRIAADNLLAGQRVIADSVNPLKITRDAYRDVASRAGVGLLEIEVVCSDAAVHRHRVETRVSSVEGLRLPTWAQVVQRHYEPWDQAPLRVDTAHRSISDCVSDVIAAIERN